MVTGPSLSILTNMSAPKIPAFGFLFILLSIEIKNLLYNFFANSLLAALI